MHLIEWLRMDRFRLNQKLLFPTFLPLHTGPEFEKSSKYYDFCLWIEPVINQKMCHSIFLRRTGEIRIFSRKFLKVKMINILCIFESLFLLWKENFFLSYTNIVIFTKNQKYKNWPTEWIPSNEKVEFRFKWPI